MAVAMPRQHLTQGGHMAVAKELVELAALGRNLRVAQVVGLGLELKHTKINDIRFDGLLQLQNLFVSQELAVLDAGSGQFGGGAVVHHHRGHDERAKKVALAGLVAAGPLAAGQRGPARRISASCVSYV